MYQLARAVGLLPKSSYADLAPEADACSVNGGSLTYDQSIGSGATRRAGTQITVSMYTYS